MSDERDRRAWIAARFDAQDAQVPREMNIGDGRTIGDYVNRPLTKRRAYKIFVRAFTAENVSHLLLCVLVSSVIVRSAYPKHSSCTSSMCLGYY